MSKTFLASPRGTVLIALSLLVAVPTLGHTEVSTGGMDFFDSGIDFWGDAPPKPSGPKNSEASSFVVPKQG